MCSGVYECKMNSKKEGNQNHTYMSSLASGCSIALRYFKSTLLAGRYINYLMLVTSISSFWRALTTS